MTKMRNMPSPSPCTSPEQQADLERLGARIEERADGLIIQESALRGAEVDGHGDHRVVMALAIAG